MIRLLLLAAALHAGEWVPMEVVATAYDPDCSICCGTRHANRTANGTNTNEAPYGVAADPRSIPFGTSVWVPTGCGYLDHSLPDERDRCFLVDDTGSALIRDSRVPGALPHIDLRFIHHANARRFGRKVIQIFIWKE